MFKSIGIFVVVWEQQEGGRTKKPSPVSGEGFVLGGAKVALINI
jgi:hypothetical protein